MLFSLPYYGSMFIFLYWHYIFYKLKCCLSKKYKKNLFVRLISFRTNGLYLGCLNLINQLNELIAITKKNKVKIVEFWFDGGWVKENNRWPVEDIYRTIKLKEPQCQVGINWTIGLPGQPDKHLVLPNQQKVDYPIRYFPSDFRLGDPYLPDTPDPKVFTHNGKSYYMSWESTICMSSRWFYNTKDTIYKSVDTLLKSYKIATSQDNILILNSPPDRDGKLRMKDIDLLMQLKKAIR